MENIIWNNLHWQSRFGCEIWILFCDKHSLLFQPPPLPCLALTAVVFNTFLQKMGESYNLFIIGKTKFNCIHSFRQKKIGKFWDFQRKKITSITSEVITNKGKYFAFNFFNFSSSTCISFWTEKNLWPHFWWRFSWKLDSESSLFNDFNLLSSTFPLSNVVFYESLNGISKLWIQWGYVFGNKFTNCQIFSNR